MVVDGAAPEDSGRAPGAGRSTMTGAPLRAIPEATVARLASYLHVLSGRRRDMAESAVSAVISSEELAQWSGVNSAKLRKDLSYLGSRGIPGVGYDVATLLDALESALGAREIYPVAIVGIGHLGSALAGHRGFSGRGFPVRALLDADSGRIGQRVAGVIVTDVRETVAVCRDAGVVIGVIATPQHAAQQVADVLLTAGVRSILNFSPGTLVVPDDVEVRQVDLALELHMLAFHELRRGGSPARWEALQQ